MNGVNEPRPHHRVPLEAMRRFDPKRLWALVLKESLQAMRDPSTLLIAFVLIKPQGLFPAQVAEKI